MAKYTTLVRSICESKAGYDEGKGGNDVDTVLSSAWNQIFTTTCTFFSESYRAVLCKKILKHYYMREIGAETAGLWQLWMNTKLEEIMPYYNKLYSSELIQFDPMSNMNLSKTRDIIKSTDGVETSTTDRTVNSQDGGNRVENYSNEISNSGSGSDSSTVNKDGTSNRDRTVGEDTTRSDAYSDTPQGSLSNVDNNAYLTNYRKIVDGKDTVDNDDVVTSEDTVTSASNEFQNTGEQEGQNTITYGKTNDITTDEDRSKTTDIDSTEQFVESVVGNNGSWNYSRLLNDFRDTFLNIDMMVINEFDDLFLKLW